MRTEAERSGLVSRVVPPGELIEETLKAAARIADFSLPAVMMVKESVNRSYEMTLSEGLRFERRVFHSMFRSTTRRKAWRLSPQSAVRSSANR